MIVGIACNCVHCVQSLLAIQALCTLSALPSNDTADDLILKNMQSLPGTIKGYARIARISQIAVQCAIAEQ